MASYSWQLPAKTQTITELVGAWGENEPVDVFRLSNWCHSPSRCSRGRVHRRNSSFITCTRPSLYPIILATLIIDCLTHSLVKLAFLAAFSASFQRCYLWLFAALFAYPNRHFSTHGTEDRWPEGSMVS